MLDVYSYYRRTFHVPRPRIGTLIPLLNATKGIVTLILTKNKLLKKIYNINYFVETYDPKIILFSEKRKNTKMFEIFLRKITDFCNRFSFSIFRIDY